MEAIGKLLDHLGYAAPLLYAAAAYGLFRWLDENLSTAAKAALASTMKLRSYGKEQVASALVEVFDRIYTRPLLSWRAFVRSLVFTTVVSAIWTFELVHSGFIRFGMNKDAEIVFAGLLFNIPSDYAALFVVRPLLIRSGARPVIGLTLGTLSGVVIVYLANALRQAVLLIIFQSLIYLLLGAGVHLLSGNVLLNPSLSGCDPTRTSDEVRFRAAVKGIADITSALVVVGRECAPSERLETSKAIAHRRAGL
jgi:hypothetical protein